MWVAEWNKVVFIDESRICLQHHDGWIRVWRHRGERMLNSCIVHHHTGPALGIMIELLPRPARSTDLSLIGNMWPMVSPRLNQITPPISTPDQLWQRVEAAFGLLYPKTISKVSLNQWRGVWQRFVEWAENEIAVVPDFHKRILFSDEAHFWLNGYVNKQNCRIWKLTVWCALWAGGIIGPYFFKNDEAHNVTVNGDRYRAMITNFFIPELNNHDVQKLWFQQDGVTCHTARAPIDLLKDTFGDRLISRFGPVNWPARSCDLTPLDCFL
ncbi:DUF4817 domain-containing protein [Trichonephila clavipes]|nr:DUF4817 domain-containing protein [Trichonephila clavipes]